MDKRKTVLALILVMMSISSCSDDGFIIQYDRLPETSKAFLNTHFSDLTPMIIKFDKIEYEIIFRSGESVEFDLHGNWKEVNCMAKAVPTSIVPKQIISKVQELYPDSYIVMIERDHRRYEVKLNTRIELEFNKNHQLSDIDYDD